MDTRSPRPAAPSLAALLGGIMKDAKDLLVQELTWQSSKDKMSWATSRPPHYCWVLG
jgi:hypothetical protein